MSINTLYIANGKSIFTFDQHRVKRQLTHVYIHYSLLHNGIQLSRIT